MAPRIRVLIVDDSAISRRLVSQVLSAQPDMEVAGFAENGRLALERVALDRPDAVVLDLEMPEMDGFQALCELKRRDATLPVLVFSSHGPGAAGTTVDALLAGADDFALKPGASQGAPASWTTAQVDLTNKLRAVASRARSSARPIRRVEVDAPPPDLVSSVPVRAIVIGTSSGGPEALAVVLPRLSERLGVPVFVVQHMPREFTAALAKRLDEKSRLRVVEATHGQRVEPGVVYLAPGDHHMRVARRPGRTVLLLDRGPLENGCRPSVNPLFASAADLYGPSLLGLVMTGMGSDGVDGARAIDSAGGHVWIQDEATSLVWGMPGAVSRAGLSRHTTSLLAIAPSLEAVVARGLPRLAPRKAET